ncbi:MAG: hypothetical protein FWC50_10255 [Planctomycetaceae bacterium]|nr:hypothetical protein [Planctomycetaceae bacterium]
MIIKFEGVPRKTNRLSNDYDLSGKTSYPGTGKTIPVSVKFHVFLFFSMAATDT